MAKQITRPAYLAVGAVALMSICQAALADVIMERTTTTTTNPVLVPSSVTTTEQVVRPDQGSILIESTAPASSSSSVTTYTDIPLSGKENFARRLQLMKEQLDSGISKGWINSVDASSLNDQYSNLSAQLNTITNQGMLDQLSNSIERGLNQFNIDLSHRMSAASPAITQ